MQALLPLFLPQPSERLAALVATRRPATLADLIAAMESNAGLTRPIIVKRRSLLRNAGLLATAGIRRAGGNLKPPGHDAVQLDQIPCDVPWLNDHIFRVSADACGMTSTLHRDSISQLRAELRAFNLVEPAIAPKLPHGTPWRMLLDQAGRKVLHGALGRLAWWCHYQDLMPEDVRSETLAAYERFVHERLLHADIPHLMRLISCKWRTAADLVPGWPQIVVNAPPRRNPYTLDWSIYPDPLVRDAQRYRTDMLGENTTSPFTEDGRKRAVRLATADKRMFCILQSLAALVHTGRSPASISGLHILVDPDAAKQILLFFWKRAATASVGRSEIPDLDMLPADVGVTSQTGGIAATLLHMARHHCKLSGVPLERLTKLVADMTPPRQSRISPKNLERLRQLDDQQVRADLLHLPEALMAQAEDMMRRPKKTARWQQKAAQLAMLAVAIELLLHIPLRISTLAKLRIGLHLKRAVGSGLISHLVIPKEDVKNDVDLEWSIGPHTAAFLDRYASKFLSLRPPGQTDLLFSATNSRKGALTAVHLGRSITRIIEERVHIIMNPHLFRGFAARLILEHAPGALEDVRLLLGDKTLYVILAHYAAIEPAHAARRWYDLLRRLRGESAHLVEPARLVSRRIRQ